MTPPSPDQLFEEVYEKVIRPFSSAREDHDILSRFPGEALRTMESIPDFELSGQALAASAYFQGHGTFLHSLVEKGDCIEKKGTSLQFRMVTPKEFVLPGGSTPGYIESSFTLALGLASDLLEDQEVNTRKEEALKTLAPSLGDASKDEILVASILPQKKKLMGVQTPVGAQIFGMRVSLRFLVASFHDARIRLFAVGPAIKEISL